MINWPSIEITPFRVIGSIVVVLSTLLFALQLPPPPSPGAIGPYLNGVFPEEAPGGNWGIENIMPSTFFYDPVRILPWPGEEGTLLIECKVGEVWLVKPEEQSRELVLDIKSQVYAGGEPGMVGMALHPRFGEANAPAQQKIYVFYRTKPNPTQNSELGYNILSSFDWNATRQQFDADSEEVLIQQYDRMSWHNGGGMFFGNDGFLYLSVGDEGTPSVLESTQRLDGGLFSGVLRIDVDNDPTRSHPIRRQPIALGDPPADWPSTFTQGYGIPDDNPWLDSQGGILEEFYAIGVRSPYSMYYDVETDRIWLNDVGSDKREEVNTVEKGDNLQWPYLEGSRPSDTYERPVEVIGEEKPAFFEYERSVGTCIVGGSVYRGSRFPGLNGKVLFADWSTDKIFALNSTTSVEPDLELLRPNLWSEAINDLDNPSVTGIYPQPDGHIYITLMGGDGWGLDNGKIVRLQQEATIAEPPSRLSDLGAFTDLSTLTPVQGFIPYSVNAPLWSDRAEKYRWMAIPNDGDFDSAEERIVFQEEGAWRFPEGTVFIKHFELPTNTASADNSRRLETRFFIIGEGGQGYGLTYKWNEEGTEAFLLGGGTATEIPVSDTDGLIYKQLWDYPSRDQCLQCHNANAGYVLGLKTHQLNGQQYYANLGRTDNQLDYLNRLGVFTGQIGHSSRYHRSFPLSNEQVDLGVRIRSYWDSNCATCHQPGGLNNIDMDLRFETPLKLRDILDAPTQSLASSRLHPIVEPGNHSLSELWVRDASTATNKMPPLARNLIDEHYIDKLAEWIDGLPIDDMQSDENLIFPNPAVSWLNVRIQDDWDLPVQYRITDMSGYQRQEGISATYELQLSMSELNAGIYVLDLWTVAKREQLKFVVQ